MTQGMTLRGITQKGHDFTTVTNVEGLLHETRDYHAWLGHRARLLRRARDSADAQGCEGPWLADLRREPGLARLLQSRRQGSLDRARCRVLPRHRGGGVQRSEQGEIHAALLAGAVRAAQEWRDRRALAQHHLDDVARRHVQLRRRQLL